MTETSWIWLIHVAVPIILAGLLNAYIYLQGWNKNQSETDRAGLPPGYVIAVVWIIILGLLGYTHFLVYPSITSGIIILSILYCLAYPFLTSGLQSAKAGIYNAIAFMIAVLVAVFVYYKDWKASLYVLPFLLWTAYVNVVTNMV